MIFEGERWLVLLSIQFFIKYFVLSLVNNVIGSKDYQTYTEIAANQQINLGDLTDVFLLFKRVQTSRSSLLFADKYS